MAHTQVIAEIGSCHDGSIDKALQLIQAAKDCGADVVKAQFWSSASRMAERRNAPEYEAIYAKYQVPEDWLPVLAKETRRMGMEFACSVYLPEDVATVKFHADIVKVSSFEANDERLLAALLRHAVRRMVVSMGLGANRYIVEEALGTDIGLLHCVTAYPAPLDALDLWKIRALGGYSDHSGDIRVGGWAFAHGARIIEAHLRLDDTDNENPDAGPHALCPISFDAYVREIRDAERAAHGSSVEAEAAMMPYKVA